MIGRGAVLGCAAVLLLSAPAHALVTVVGSGLAHDCFIAAKAGVDPRGGIATCTEALEEEALDKHNRAGTYVNRGVMRVMLGQFKEAMADYDTGLALEPDLGDGHVDRGAVLISLKRYDEAIAEINKGIDLGQTYEHVGYYDRGVAEYFLGRITESYYDFKKASEIAPDFLPAQEQLKNFVVTRSPVSSSNNQTP
jgi:tetratricopeptide (TPR) repeat protein